MLRDSLEDWMVAAIIFGVVAAGLIGAGWSQLLEHHRRKQAMDVIKVAIQAGRDPPSVVYDQLKTTEAPKAPWSEVVVFTALGFGFWVAYANATSEDKTPFLVVASTMTATALGCLALAIMRPGRGRDDNDASE